MNKLADDCFNQVEDLMSMSQALEILQQRIVIVTGDRLDRLPLARAAGRILAENLVSVIDVPPHDNSAVDGYALRHEDLSQHTKTTLPIQGRSAAGHPYDGELAPGQCIRIFPGAVMPSGADSIVMQEDVVFLSGAIIIPSRLKLGANRRLQG